MKKNCFFAFLTCNGLICPTKNIINILLFFWCQGTKINCMALLAEIDIYQRKILTL